MTVTSTTHFNSKRSWESEINSNKKTKRESPAERLGRDLRDLFEQESFKPLSQSFKVPTQPSHLPFEVEQQPVRMVLDNRLDRRRKTIKEVKTDGLLDGVVPRSSTSSTSSSSSSSNSTALPQPTDPIVWLQELLVSMEGFNQNFLSSSTLTLISNFSSKEELIKYFTSPDYMKNVADHAKARLLLYYLMAQVISSVPSINSQFKINNFAAQLQFHTGGHEWLSACHHTFLPNLKDDFLTALKAAVFNELYSACRNNRAIDPELILKLMVLGVKAQQIQQLVDETFKTSQETNFNIQVQAQVFFNNTKNKIDTIWNQTFGKAEQNDFLNANLDRPRYLNHYRLFNDQSKFTYLNNHCLIGWMLNPVDDHIETLRPKGVELLNKVFQQVMLPNEAVREIGKEFINNLDEYIRNAREFLGSITEFQDALKEMQDIRKNLEYTPQNPARFVTRFNAQSERLCAAARQFAKRAKLAKMLNQKYEPIVLNSGRETTIEQYCNYILSLFPVEVFNKNAQTLAFIKTEVKTAFDKKMDKEVFKPKFALEKEISDLNKKIQSSDQKIAAIFAHYERQPNGFLGRSLVKGWMDKVQSLGGGYDAFRPLVPQIAKEIQKNSDPIVRDAQLKLLDNFRDYLRCQDELSKCRSVIASKQELLKSLDEKATNQEPIWNALMEQFIKDQSWSEPAKQRIVETAHMLHNYYQRVCSSDFQFPITKEEVEQLVATATEQQKATREVLKQLELFFISTKHQQVTRVVAPYLLQRTITPVFEPAA